MTKAQLRKEQLLRTELDLFQPAEPEPPPQKLTRLPGWEYDDDASEHKTSD